MFVPRVHQYGTGAQSPCGKWIINSSVTQSLHQSRSMRSGRNCSNDSFEPILLFRVCNFGQVDKFLKVVRVVQGAVAGKEQPAD
jgi:hypothetical protein